MSEPMVVKYLVTRAHIDTGTNSFLSATCNLAQGLGKDKSQERQLDYVKALFTAMTAHLGSREILSRLKAARTPHHSSIGRIFGVNHPETLAIAVVLKDVPCVKSLLEAGVDANIESDFGSPLVIATNTGQLEIARLLLNHGADVNKGIRYWDGHWISGPCALHAAASAGNQQLLRLILRRKYCGVTSGGEYERAIYLAAKGGHDDLVWFLIDRGTHFSGLVHLKSNVMIEGAKAGRIGIVRMMLNHGIQVGFQVPGDHDALYWSSHGGHLQVARLLLESGAHVNPSHDGPLPVAAKNGHLEVVKLLLDFAGWIHTDTWNACLKGAAREGHLAMVRFVCSANRADLSTGRPTSNWGEFVELGFDALNSACEMSHYDIVRLLVSEHGYDPCGYGNEGQPPSPMMIALRKGNAKLVSLLLSLGASSADPTQSRHAALFANGTYPEAGSKWA